MACRYQTSIERVAASPRTVVGTRASVEGDEQVIRIPPEELAASASVGVDVYSLARAVESEWGSGPPAGMVAVAEVIRNSAKQRGMGVTELLLKDRHEGESGFYGRQSGRYAATSVSPTERSIAAAEAALEGTAVAGGAEKFLHPIVSDRGLQAGRTIKDALTVLAGDGKGYAGWFSEGWRFVSGAPLYLDWCVDPYTGLFLLGNPARTSAGTASNSQARQIILNGRKASGITV